MPVASLLATLPFAASESLSEIVPFLVVLGTGFLVGAWGQAAKAPLAVVAGILLVVLAILGFFLENSSGPSPSF
ncbi:MAG: hypothetical protein M3383_05940 [Actinomycetota bacterium]|nr:hypothetical protein [Actinomycetota bacterium]